jgi:4-hydroxy-tetrahydrodipicolinate synthase
VLQGDERVMAACLLMGGDGVIAGLANVAPRLFVNLVHAATRADVATSRQLQERISDLWTLFTPGTMLPALYAACSALGLGSGRPAEPWIPSNTEEQRAIAAILRRHGLLEAAAVGSA